MELLNDMALFVEVVKAMGFRRAADAMGMPSSTLSRRISALEKSIGLRLLHRTTRKIELTEAGQLYFERCKRIVDDALLAHEQLGKMLEQPSGLLRISLPVDFANTYLAPLITEFSQRYPGINFDFDLTPRRVDLVTEPFDLAIRIGILQDSNLIARQITKLPRYLYASPRYLARFGVLHHPEDLLQHQCLRLPKEDIWTLYSEKDTVKIKVSGRFVQNSVGMSRRFAELDQGITIQPEQMVATELASGNLCRVLSDWEASPISVYAMTETRLLPAKTQRFIEFLRENLNQ
jgi:DNA-binding transcriptional LysR family regulator